MFSLYYPLSVGGEYVNCSVIVISRPVCSRARILRLTNPKHGMLATPSGISSVAVIPFANSVFLSNDTTVDLPEPTGPLTVIVILLVILFLQWMLVIVVSSCLTSWSACVSCATTVRVHNITAT